MYRELAALLILLTTAACAERSRTSQSDTDLADRDLAEPDLGIQTDISGHDAVLTDALDGEVGALTPAELGVSAVYLDRPYDETGWTEPEFIPVSAAWFRLVGVADGRTLVEGPISDSGTLEIRLHIEASMAARLEVVSRSESPYSTVTVVDREDREPYEFVSERLLLSPGSRVEYDFVFEDDSSSGVFNILSVASQGLDFIGDRRPGLEDDPLTLSVMWQSGEPSPCGTCFNGFRIDLRDDAEDPDAFDDDIILHEVGHFVQSMLSVDDSPGGSHDGTPTDPTLAYGEGFAHFFSAWVRGQETYFDYRARDWRRKNLETLEDQYLGTADGTEAGDVSEFLVAGFLWDLVDDDSEEEYDGFSDEEWVVEALFEWMRTNPGNSGVTGVDLTDLIEALRCTDAEGDEVLAALLDEFGFPFDPGTEPHCSD